MAKVKKGNPKKRGRPATGKDPLVSARMPPNLLREFDAWAKSHVGGSRSEALRRLVERALRHAKAQLPLSKEAARKAAQLADREIDRLGDKTATGEEQASRKRRLISGPKEFRDMRRKM